MGRQGVMPVIPFNAAFAVYAVEGCPLAEKGGLKATIEMIRYDSHKICLIPAGYSRPIGAHERRRG